MPFGLTVWCKTNKYLSHYLGHQNGEAQVNQLLIEGLPWAQFIQKNQEESRTTSTMTHR
jgi:hypothetical protein